MEPSGQGKIPSLAELQSSIGDLGYEVIVVDHKFDNALQEMKEVAQCCLLGCPDITVLVRRIAEVVADHMGGPVIDANDMITRWLSKSIEQRTSHQTSLLHIGSIEIGLSRHRALLFKVISLSPSLSLSPFNALLFPEMYGVGATNSPFSAWLQCDENLTTTHTPSVLK